MHLLSTHLWRVLLATLLLAVLAAGPARADLNGSVTIALLAPGGVIGDPTPLSFADVVGPGDGDKLLPGDGSQIGGYMLPLERIAFAGNSLRLTIAVGGVQGGDQVTGYLGDASGHARYEFSGLSIIGRQIVGLALSDKDGFLDSGFSGLLSPASPSGYVHLLDAHRLSVDLDSLVFRDRGLGESLNHLDLRIDLLTQPVPEPARVVLLLAVLLVLLGRRLGGAAR